MIEEMNSHKGRIAIIIRGAVQGVGFRPFVYKLAQEMNLKGWVLNSSQGVFIEAEGQSHQLIEFILRIQNDAPPLSSIQSFEFSYLEPVGYNSFEIRKSNDEGEKTALVLPDIATCNKCLEEIFDINNRRYLYPFTNCTHCGPRFTIIEALPYDRINTSMKKFVMCKECQSEYENPDDRRFHAQPNACPVCGPHVELWNAQGKPVAVKEEALSMCVNFIREGAIVAVKGIGGFHLVADAGNDVAVKELRKRKHREEKPFALMAPSISYVNEICEVNDLEKRLLLSPEAPIVLLKRKKENAKISRYVAPDNPYYGIMLPYSPLHHILLHLFQKAVVATSGNISDEPICTDEHEAIVRLRSIADFFLVHNRPIIRHCDDSIVRVILGRELVLRRARGYAPLPLKYSNTTQQPILAVGAHLKNTVALSNKSNIFVSQHIGDLETHQSYDAFHRVIQDFEKLFDTKPSIAACDLHPDYLSTKYAKKLEIEIKSVQHHLAHILSCIAENRLEGDVLGIGWDGTGYGTDGNIWGGEFYKITDTGKEHVATFAPFPLIGGDKAIKEPRRTALGILYSIYGEQLFEKKEMEELLNSMFKQSELKTFRKMLEKEIQTVRTTSVGRLFDGVAAVRTIRNVVRFEGQAAMELEFLAENDQNNDYYSFELKNTTPDGRQFYEIQWQPIVVGLLEDRVRYSKAFVARKFHNTLAEIIVSVARCFTINKVALSGGCFQNVILMVRTIQRLQEEGFRPYWHQRIPPNDGGIALGQIVAAMRLKK